MHTTVKLDDENAAIVQAATLLVSFRRDRLNQSLINDWIEDHETLTRPTADEAGERLTGVQLAVLDPDGWMLRRIYSDLVAATVRIEGFDWPVSYLEFAAWDGALYLSRLSPWYEAILDLNPHWLAGEVTEGEGDGAPGNE